MEIVHSVADVPIRLTEERWEHITANKPYMTSHYENVLEAVEKPTWVLRGYAGTLVAVLTLGPRNYLHVVYREVGTEDGFVVTAFISDKVNRRLMIWPKRP